jgi:TetR/AcrR family transcriptional repressor of nem operon
MKAMGIARRSLYDTFGDKRALYVKALAFYRDETNGDMQRMLKATPSVKDGFAKLLFGLAAETREQHERGCLLLSANLQRDARDAVIADFLRDNQARVEAIFAGCAAQTRGNSRTHDPKALAHFFVVTILFGPPRASSDRQALNRWRASPWPCSTTRRSLRPELALLDLCLRIIGSMFMRVNSACSPAAPTTEGAGRAVGAGRAAPRAGAR